ncbi:zinc ribbon domain-containing protein [Novosphingobium bradum]|uniref:Zinc ribbon domain-containing protein n=1 Tax=Novosphingobium bradum TaxID=1737444 RepID=A0ABV7INA6_9SPHN
MLKAARAPEKAYAIVLWLVSVVFAGFIIGLGNLVIGDLPQVGAGEYGVTAPSAAEQRLGREIAQVSERIGQIDDRRAIVQLQLDQARKASQTGTETFQAWIATRTATTNPAQDPEVVARTRQLEALKAGERTLQGQVNAFDNERLPLEQQRSELQGAQARAAQAAEPARERARFWQELRVFLLRLAVTLPMLAVGTWLVARKRKSDYWPLGRGFVLAAVFVFFVELVPYLPSYGGYVRYGVGILLTFAAGVFLIKNMRRYLESRQKSEAQAEAERRARVSHDEAFRKMAARQCPGCDRPIATMEGAETNFCVHCGMTLFDHCPSCHSRKMAFFRFCMACGTPAQAPARANATPPQGEIPPQPA